MSAAHKYLLALLAVSLLFMPACSAGEKKRIAEAGVDKFHAQLEAGQFHDIYAESTPEFQKSDSEAQINEFFTAIHKKLGRFRSTQEQRFLVNYTTSGTLVTLDYESTYESGPAT